MFVIEEVFRSMDENCRKRMLEDILVRIVMNTKYDAEPNPANRAANSTGKNI